MKRKPLFIIFCITTLTLSACGKTETPVISNSIETETTTETESVVEEVEETTENVTEEVVENTIITDETSSNSEGIVETPPTEGFDEEKSF